MATPAAASETTASKREQSAKSKAAQAPKKPPKQAKWSSDDDAVFIEVLTEQATEGKTSDNGWKSSVWTAAMVALKGSEMFSGGAPKSAAACARHWDKVSDTICNISSYPDYFHS